MPAAISPHPWHSLPPGWPLLRQLLLLAWLLEGPSSHLCNPIETWLLYPTVSMEKSSLFDSDWVLCLWANLSGQEDGMLTAHTVQSLRLLMQDMALCKSYVTGRRRKAYSLVQQNVKLSSIPESTQHATKVFLERRDSGSQVGKKAERRRGEGTS